MRKRGIGAVIAMLSAVMCLTGCSRAVINYQIAEAIGTDGKYANNEPVETPKMRQDRELVEAQESEQEAYTAVLAQAEKLAKGYYYQEAIDLLGTMDVTDPEVDHAIQRYTEEMNSLEVYEGSIPHLCFPVLIEDSVRAFAGNDMTSTYANTMITTQEFTAILENLYADGYVLIDIHSVASEVEDQGKSITTMEAGEIKLPEGKKPIILSQDNLNYYGVRAKDGIATALAMDGNVVKAKYVDEDGHDLLGDYDLIPIVDSFVEEHPDFSYQGAKGIVSVSGSNGVFGYNMDKAEDQNTVRKIAEALKESGWQIACAGYTHSYMNDMLLGQIQSELDNWEEKVGTYVGKTDILFYPYGGEVGYPSDQLDELINRGYVYLCGLWGEQDYLDIETYYLRQTRRFVDGSSLTSKPEYFAEFFDADAVLSEDR